MSEPYDDDDETSSQVWHDAMAWLLAGGRTAREAIDGANLIVEAWKRRRDEAQMRGGALEQERDEQDSRDEGSGVRVLRPAVGSLLSEGRTPTETFVGASPSSERWERMRDEAQKRGGRGGGGDDRGSADGSSAA